MKDNTRLSRAQSALSGRNGNGVHHAAFGEELPPHNPNLERCLLGDLLRDPAQIVLVMEKAGDKELFYSDAHSIIFEVMRALHRKGKTWDILILDDELRRHDGFKLKDASNYLDEIFHSVAHAVCTEEHVERLKRYATQRELIQNCLETMKEAYLDDYTGDELATRAKTRFVDLEPAPAAAAHGANGQINWSLLSDADMGMRLASSIKSKRIEWLMPNRIPALAYTLIAGEGKQGKSQLTMAMGALISTGGQWWDGSGDVPQGHVLYLSAEDDAERVIKPRLEALDANLDMITILEARYKRPSKDGKESLVDTEAELSSLEYWQDVFRRIKDPRVMFIDPLPSYIGRGVNDRKNAEVRAVLHPFIRLASNFGITTIGVTHLGKSVDPTRPIANRVLDSIAYTNLARAVHFVAKDPADPGRKLFLPGPCNYSATGVGALAFSLEDRQVVLEDGSTAVVAVAEFEEGTVDADAQDVVGIVGKKKPGPPSKVRGQIAEWLYEFLKNGQPVLAVDCYNSAAEAFSEIKPNPLGVKNEKGYWSKGFTLTRAADIDLPKLPYPMNGKLVDKFKDPTQNNRWYWQLADARPAAGQGDLPF